MTAFWKLSTSFAMFLKRRSGLLELRFHWLFKSFRHSWRIPHILRIRTDFRPPSKLRVYRYPIRTQTSTSDVSNVTDTSSATLGTQDSISSIHLNLLSVSSRVYKLDFSTVLIIFPQMLEWFQCILLQSFKTFQSELSLGLRSNCSRQSL